MRFAFTLFKVLEPLKHKGAVLRTAKEICIVSKKLWRSNPLPFLGPRAKMRYKSILLDRKCLSIGCEMFLAVQSSVVH